MLWQHFVSPQIRLVDYFTVNDAIFHNRIDTLIVFNNWVCVRLEIGLFDIHVIVTNYIQNMCE